VPEGVQREPGAVGHLTDLHVGLWHTATLPR
jgi:hypothetical protein